MITALVFGRKSFIFRLVPRDGRSLCVHALLNSVQCFGHTAGRKSREIEFLSFFLSLLPPVSLSIFFFFGFVHQHRSDERLQSESELCIYVTNAC